MVERMREKIIFPLGVFGIIIYMFFRITELNVYVDWDYAVYISIIFISGLYLHEYSIEEELAGFMIAGAVVGFMYFIMTMFTDFFPSELTDSLLKYDILIPAILLTIYGALIEVGERIAS